jgi:hypothetical protein
MEGEKLQAEANPEQLSRYARERFLEEVHRQSGHGGHANSSVREVEYKGRKIRIETTYRITIDDEPVLGQVMVENTGRVHYHSIPNQEFKSAVDMVKRVIDLVPPFYSPHASHGR